MSEYPYRSGDFIVLGPETFSDAGKTVICHKGENYYIRQDDPPTVDPADVKAGDVVEVTLTGTVTSVGEIGFVLEHADDGNDAQIPFDGATVRLVRRAEPEPDPEQVEAIRDTYGHVLRMNLGPEEAAALWRLGVRVEAPDA